MTSEEMKAEAAKLEAEVAKAEAARVAADKKAADGRARAAALRAQADREHIKELVSADGEISRESWFRILRYAQDALARTQRNSHGKWPAANIEGTICWYCALERKWIPQPMDPVEGYRMNGRFSTVITKADAEKKSIAYNKLWLRSPVEYQNMYCVPSWYRYKSGSLGMMPNNT